MLNRLTPRVVWIALAAVFLSAMVFRTGALLHWWPLGLNPNVPFGSLMVIAYAVSFRFCFSIAADHRSSPPMRFAWLLLAASAGLSIVRHSLQVVAAAGRWKALTPASLYVVYQLPMALALITLFVALLAMWRALAALRLGSHARRMDIVVVGLMLMALPPILVHYQDRLPAQTPRWALILPIAGAVFLPACGAAAVLLHRIALQTRGGGVSRVLLCLIWLPGVRLAAMLLTVDPHLRSVPLFTVLAYSLYQCAPLVFTLAVAYRWQMGVRAREIVRSLENASMDLVTA